MITRLKLSTVTQGLPKYRSMLAGNDAYVPPSFESIASTTSTGSSNTVTFSSIPGTYQHLQVRFLLNQTDASTIRLRLNGNSSTASYVEHQLDGNGATVSAWGSASGVVSGIALCSATSTASIFTVGIIDIHDYISTSKNKTVRAFSGDDRNGSGNVYLRSGLFLSTSAVTSLTIYASGASFTSGSVFSLYGIKGA